MLVRFREDPLDDGLAFYAFVTTGGDVLECGIGDDRAEALVALYGTLVAYEYQTARTGGEPADTEYRAYLPPPRHEAGDDLGFLEHPAPNLEAGDVVACGRARRSTARVEVKPGPAPLVAMLEVAVPGSRCLKRGSAGVRTVEKIFAVRAV
jgi:hypothetical protein